MMTTANKVKQLTAMSLTADYYAKPSLNSPPFAVESKTLST
jgi:hypothetical protein